MNYVIKTGRSVEEAVSEALKELNISKDEANIEILEEGNKGFLGIIGTKDATVKVTKIEESTSEIIKEIFNKDLEQEKSQIQEEPENKIENNFYSVEESTSNEAINIEEENENIIRIAKEFMNKIIDVLGLEGELSIDIEDNILTININGDENKLGIIIGKRGITLDSIQYILNLIVNRNSSRYIKVSLDSSGYREKRKQTLEDLANKMAIKVLRNNRAIRLEPMNAYERKIIHEALQNYEGVITHSEGKDPYRKVVIQKERKY